MAYNFDITKLSNLSLENFSNGGPVVLEGVRVSYEYQNNLRTDKVNGLKVTVVLPANRYEKLTVTVADPVDRLSAVLDKTPAGTPVMVAFVNFTAKVYRDRNGDKAISAKADSVRIVADDDDLIIE